MHRIMQKVKNIKEHLYNTGFVHVFGSDVINQMFAFISGILLVRIMSKTEYGVYSYAYNIVHIFLIFNGLGVTSAMLQTCSEESRNEIRESYFFYARKVGILFDILLGISLALVAWFVPFKLRGAGEILIFMCLMPLGILAFQIRLTYLRATIRMKEFSYANLCNTLLYFIFSIVGVLLFHVKGLVFGQTLSYFLTTALITIFFRMSISFPRKKLSRERRYDFMKIALISAATAGISQIMNVLDVFILGIQIPDERIIASYKVATVIPLSMVIIPNAVVTCVYPYFAKNKDNRQWLEVNYKRLLCLVGAVNAMISFLLIVLSPVIVRLVFGAQYLDAVPAFCVFALNYFFTGTFNSISGNLLVTQRKLKFNFWRSLIMGGINLIGNIVLISMFGAVGAAISTLGVGIIGGLAATWKMAVTIRGKTDVQKK